MIEQFDVPATILRRNCFVQNDVQFKDALTGAGIAAIWPGLLGKPGQYGGDAAAPLERTIAQFGPSWAATDLRLMPDRFRRDGTRASPHDVGKMTGLLGRPAPTAISRPRPWPVAPLTAPRAGIVGEQSVAG